MNDKTYPGPAQMVMIDGSQVRRLREAKGLTQLYMATVVGVTTDTISRWENKRYPSIKEDNAQKLAEALEVPLEEILEKEGGKPAAAAAPSAVIPHARQVKANRLLPWLLPLVLVLLLPFVWYRYNQPVPVTIIATRLLPPHIPAGQPFPVIIEVRTKQPGPFSLILKEKLPEGCEPLVSSPPYTGFDARTGILKWINRTAGERTTFVYLAVRKKEKSGTLPATPLRFSGSVTLRDKKSPETGVAGSLVLPIAGYHWADANRDNSIEDEEILAVYDTFSGLDNISYDWQKIDEIWSGGGYTWDAAKEEYVIRK
jgi:transcriptional regulator with XRE-family HTH domain